MRKEKELVNVTRMVHNKQNALRLQGALDAPEVRIPQYLKDWIVPRKETRLMSDEAQRIGGVFIPYPLLGILLTLTLALGGGILALYVQVSTMNATMLMRDADYRKQVDKLEEKLELQEMYTKDIREQLGILKERTEPKKR